MATKPHRIRDKHKLKCWRKNLFLILTVLGIVVGIALGFSLRLLKLSEDALTWIGMPGEMFMRFMKLMILPLIICSVIAGTASLNPKANGKISVIAICLCLVNNIIGSVLGLMVAYVIRPGRLAMGGELSEVTQSFNIQDIFADLIRNLVPDNIIEACFRQAQTKYLEQKGLLIANVTNDSFSSDQILHLKKVVGKADGPNIIGVIVVCIIFGVATNRSREKGKKFLQFFTSATEVILIVLRWQLWCVPVGVCSLIAVSLATIVELEKTFIQIGFYVLTVTIGILIHQLIIVPLILFLVAQRNPFRYIISQSRAWMIGFSTTSTAVALPEILHVCESVHNIDARVARFVAPLVTTLSAGGSAVYISVSVVFIATMSGSPLNAGGIVTLIILTSIAAMAIPSVPSAGIVTLIIILTALNLPSDQLGFLFAVEWYLDRIRTSSNLLNNAVSPAVVYRFCKENLTSMESAPCAHRGSLNVDAKDSDTDRKDVIEEDALV